ncbi:MAG: 2'-5' RNA ligase family protein [Planctomycetota bacterium]|jgi:2'-5' RNA ligase
MAKIAVDVVLLPSEDVAERAIRANRELLSQGLLMEKQRPDKIVLDKESCLPHISLAMGCIDESDIADIEAILGTIAEQHSLERLHSFGIHVGTNSAGEKVSVVPLEITEPLQSLHEQVMQTLAAYFSYDVTADMVLSPPPACESTLLWIRDYPENSSFERFFPHITIGYGQIEKSAFPSEFTASRLALCHLGNHCTCRKILASAEISS